MKLFKFTFVIMAAFLVTLGLSATAGAFHAGGVAECGGCHSMHSPVAGGSFLLLGADPSSTCLNCHQHAGDSGPSSYHISTAETDMPAGAAPLQRTPGGDFGWLKKDYTFTVRGTTSTEFGRTHGHNIIAGAYGYAADTDNTTAPGGSYSANNLSCISCHDPHSKRRRLDDGSIAASTAPIVRSGSYNNSTDPGPGEAVGVFRLLRGGDLEQGGIVTAEFPGNPAAVTPSSYNRTEAATQTRTAYGSSATDGHARWGSWCGTCHGNMHSEAGTRYVHPVDEGLDAIAATYNMYVKTGDVTGVVGSSFTSLVPFMENTADYAVLRSHAQNNDTVLTGPGSTDQVSCLSCHRAHASGWEYMLRWNMEGEFITYNGAFPGTDNGAPPQFARGRSSAETQAAYYDRTIDKFASYQRVLCNKCHAKD